YVQNKVQACAYSGSPRPDRHGWTQDVPGGRDGFGLRSFLACPPGTTSLRATSNRRTWPRGCACLRFALRPANVNRRKSVALLSGMPFMKHLCACLALLCVSSLALAEAPTLKSARQRWLK